MFPNGSSRVWLLMALVAIVLVAQISFFVGWQQRRLAALQAATMSSEAVLSAALDILRHPAVSAPAQLVQQLAVELGCSPYPPAPTATTSSPRAASPVVQRRPVYVVTTTYRRPEQLAELTRTAQTLMHVPALRWLVVEDATRPTTLVTELLDWTGIPYDHLTAQMPERYKKRTGQKPRGVSNRNRGLEWVRANATVGVLYFADDDNTYDIRLFEEIRSTRRVAMWPVGLVAEYGLSTPVVADGEFQGFYESWKGGRKFPVDMAGFAVSVEFLLQRPRASFPYEPGNLEDGFLKSLAPFEARDIELKAKNCTEILVWHTHTKKNKPSTALDMERYNNTNLVLLKKIIV